MASFGSFETEREVYSDPNYTVYFARKSGDPAGEYAVKVFRLPASELEAELTGQSVSREELEQARSNTVTVQQRGAASSQYIAPVLERGKDQRGVWYATRFYPRSVNKMMSGKVALPRASLEHIVSSIAQGALDLKRACGRSHGDLRPTNIQVSKSEKLTEAEVVLCDPLPGGQDQAAQYERNDLCDIGVILLQLVRQRPIRNEDLAAMVPIAPSDEWVRLFGSDASDWLALCNRLLDPHLSPEHFRLEDLVGRLNELKPKRGGSPKLALAVGTGVLLVVALGLWMLRPHSGTIMVTSDPPGASIVVDQAKQQGQTPVQLKLGRGDHVLEARLDELGLAEEATNCVIEAGKRSRVHFQFEYGTVAINSEPPGATILKDGVALGTIANGKPLIVPPGPVKYELKLEQYEPAIVTGIVPRLQRLDLKAILLRSQKEKSTVVSADTGSSKPVQVDAALKPVHVPAQGVLELSTQPVAASILDNDGRQLGQASADKPLSLRLAPGTYLLKARTEGLDDVPGTLRVEAGTTNRHVFQFEYGTVDWTSQPVPATVRQENQTQTTPASFRQKPDTKVSYVITAPGYQTSTQQVMVAKGQRTPRLATLAPQLVSLELVSDPPGAEFLSEDGTALRRNQTNQLLYDVPEGAINLVARHPILGSMTNPVALVASQNAPKVQFTFEYGTLILTNLPMDVAVYEGQTRIGSAADKWAYQKRGPHLYALRGQGDSETIQTNINTGLNYLLRIAAQKSWKNSLGMWFAWVPNLPGGGVWPGQKEPGGWVGLTEVTQGEFKKMDGTNPSAYREGGDMYPVENLTREQAASFCGWLSSADTAEHLGWRYALPTDEQFAAFAGDADRVARITNEGRMSNNTDDLFPTQRLGRIPAAANLGNGNARTHPEPVASTQHSNQFGLYDVVGNVWEWLAGSRSKDNVYAGGSYLNFSAKTVGTKAREKTLEKGPNIGFRVVLVPPQ